MAEFVPQAPYFDQEQPEAPIVGMIADEDQSQPYELDAAAVFKLRSRGYLVVFVSGCSCWPDRGSTYQHICPTKTEVDRQLTGNWRTLLQKCQLERWRVQGATS